MNQINFMISKKPPVYNNSALNCSITIVNYKLPKGEIKIVTQNDATHIYKLWLFILKFENVKTEDFWSYGCYVLDLDYYNSFLLILAVNRIHIDGTLIIKIIVILFSILNIFIQDKLLCILCWSNLLFVAFKVFGNSRF